MKLLIQLLVNGFITGLLYTLIAISFGIVYRSTRIFHIALGAIYISAAYGMYLGVKMGILGGILAGILSALLLSVGIEHFVYAPFSKKNSSLGVVLIASLGIYIFFENFIALIFGSEVKVISKGIEPSLSLGCIILTRTQIIQFVVGIILLFCTFLGLKKTKFLKAIWAMGDEPLLLEVLGVPIFRLRKLIFVISALFVSIASMLNAYDIGIAPYQGLSAILLGAVAVLVGGVDNLWGWIATSFLIAWIQSFAIWLFSACWNDAITFAILILVLLFKPNGLFTIATRVEEQ